MTISRRVFCGTVLGAAFSVSLLLSPHGRAQALEVGQRAPDFKLPSTMGGDIALSDYRGKKWVLLEFYGADFSPT